jgi:ligand-binding sensor domain-containing protein
MKNLHVLLIMFVAITACNGQRKSGAEFIEVTSLATNSKEQASIVPIWSCNYSVAKVTDLLGEGAYRGPGNFVKHVLQDRNGAIWFGSGEGIFRYDSNRANHPCTRKTCKHDLLNPAQLFIHNNELNKAFFNLSDGKKLTDFHVNYIFEDNKGVLWFGTTYHGLCRYDGNTFTSYRKKDGLNDNFVNCILQDREGKLWIATEGGVAIFDGDTFTKLTTSDGLISNQVYTIVEDASGKIWFGTEGGVSFYDGIRFTNFNNSSGKAFQTVRSLIFDHAGNLWIGSLNGVSKFNTTAASNPGLKSFTDFTVKDGLADNFVYNILEDKSGNFWFALCDEFGRGMGVCFYDGKSFKNITKDDGIMGNRVYTILEDKKGNIWFATASGISMFDGENYYNITERGQVDGC